MKLYYYIEGRNQQAGPVSEEVLVGMLQKGDILLQTPVWTEGMPDWRPIGEIFPEFGRKKVNKNVLWIVLGGVLVIVMFAIAIAGCEAQRKAEAQAAEERYYQMRANLDAEARRHQRGQEIALRTLEQLIKTGEISAPGRMEGCRRCNGSGVVPTGNVFSSGYGRYEMICPQCQGAGRCPANQNPYYSPY